MLIPQRLSMTLRPVDCYVKELIVDVDALYGFTQLPAYKQAPRDTTWRCKSDFVSVVARHLRNWSITDTSTRFATEATPDMEDWSETACTKCPATIYSDNAESRRALSHTRMTLLMPLRSSFDSNMKAGDDSTTGKS